jgi:glycosyltransferase involved in cell wall biosynthesis
MKPEHPRICLLVSSFYPVVGGGETHARLLCKEFRRRGVDVFVLTRHRVKESPVFETVDDIPIHRVPPSGVPRLGKYLMLLPAFMALCRSRNDYDLIYVCGLRILGIIGVLAALLLGKKCVLRSESRGEFSGGFIWNNIMGETTRPVMKALFRGPIRLRNYFLKKADAFLSISGIIREEFEACGIPSSQIASIANGIDTDTFQPAAPARRLALKKQLHLPEDRFLFAYSGKLNRGKGLDFLMQIWPTWLTKHPKSALVLIGGGSMQFLSCETELREFVKTHHLEESVLFTGYVTNVNEYLQASDAFLFPSESEALPLALLEALACGLPTIASDIGGNRDVVIDGQEGRIAPLKDEKVWLSLMDSFIARPEAAQKLAQKGRQTVCERFSIAYVADEHLKLFDRICKEPA